MEKLPRRKSEIVALYSQSQKQIQSRIDGVKIEKGKFECTCCICGKAISGRNKTVDHKTPISRGGTNKFENLCMCCASCNSKKQNKRTFKR